MHKPASLASDLDFYAEAVRMLQAARIPFLVGGAYALRQYTGVVRDTKDFDIFVRPAAVEALLTLFRDSGFRAEMAWSHWIAKVHYGENFIDVIFRAGNGLCDVDDLWFRGREESELLGDKVPLVPAEEMIWQKAYIMERERFDGADIAHLLRGRAERIDWDHLLARFGDDWRILFMHFTLFGFIYPAERCRIPAAVMERLTAKLQAELHLPGGGEKLCNGTLISRAQYLPDIERWNYRDARLLRSKITPRQIEEWTNAIGNERAWA